MAIFEKRPLALLLCIMAGGFILYSCADDFLKTFLNVIALVLLALTFIRQELRHKFKRALILMLILSFFLSSLYFTLTKIDESSLPAGDYTIEAEVYEVAETSSEYAQILSANTLTIGGDTVRYNIKIFLYGKHDVEPGDLISFTGRLESFESGGDFDFQKYYAAQGFIARADASEIIIVEGTSEPLKSKISRLRLSICELFVETFGDNEGGLLSALLLGEKQFMSSKLLLDFKRIGLLHVLALSGMHLAIISAFIGKILSALKINRRLNMIIICIFVAAYMALTGFPSSVCRAGLMLIISSVVYLLSGCKDNLTSLFVALTVILLVEPYAALDIGLILSAAATFGVIVASDYISRTEIKPLYKFLYVSLMTSVFAVCATFAVAALSFDSFSWISPVTTLIFSFLVEVFVYLGIIFLPLSYILPVSDVYSFVYALIEKVAEIFSSIPYVSLSNSHVLIKAVSVITGLLFFAAAVIKCKNRKTVASVVVIAFLLTNLTGLIVNLEENSSKTVEYVCNGEDEFVIARSCGEVALIQINPFSSSVYSIKSALYKIGVTEIEYYVIPDYEYYVSSSVEEVLSSYRVENVLLPTPKNAVEGYICKELCALTDIFGCAVLSFDDKEIIEFESFSFAMIGRGEFAVTDTAFAFAISLDSELYTYLSSGALEQVKDSEALLYVSRSLIFGSYGKEYSKDIILDSFGERLDSIVISSPRLYVTPQYSEKVKTDFSGGVELLLGDSDK